MSTIPQHPSNRGQRREPESQPQRPPERAGFPAIRRGDDGPLQRIADAAQVVPAVSGQAKGCFRELLFQHARPEFHQQVGLDGSGVPQTVSGSRRDRQLLALPQREAGPMDGKGRRP